MEHIPKLTCAALLSLFMSTAAHPMRAEAAQAGTAGGASGTIGTGAGVAGSVGTSSTSAGIAGASGANMATPSTIGATGSTSATNTNPNPNGTIVINPGIGSGTGNINSGLNNPNISSGLNVGANNAVSPNVGTSILTGTNTNATAGSTALNNNMSNNAMAGNTIAGSVPPVTTSWAAENDYWRANFATRPYSTGSRGYADFAPAYQYGVEAFNTYGGRRFEDIDMAQLQAGWTQRHGASPLSWNEAQAATRDAYDRMYQNHLIASGTTAAAGR